VILATTKNLIFDSGSNLILLRTIAVPTPAHNLSVANSEFDQVVLTKRKHWVSVSGIIEFQNRNNVISILESYQGTYVFLGDQSHIKLSTLSNNIFR
jgi:hypothetical protein